MDASDIEKELEKLKGTLVIVEGIKDKAAMKKLGITKVLTLSRKPLYAIVEEASSEKEVAVLTDLDIKGKQLYSRLSKDLKRHGVKINNKLRKMLFKSKLRHIEGLPTYLNTPKRL